MVSAHLQSAGFAVTAAAQPSLIYDYYGFPEHTYALRYPAPGAPALAERVAALLAQAGLPGLPDAGRGFDHGRSEEYTYELQSLMRTSYAGFCLNKKKNFYNHC